MLSFLFYIYGKIFLNCILRYTAFFLWHYCLLCWPKWVLEFLRMKILQKQSHLHIWNYLTDPEINMIFEKRWENNAVVWKKKNFREELLGAVAFDSQVILIFSLFEPMDSHKMRGHSTKIRPKDVLGKFQKTFWRPLEVLMWYYM